MSGSVRLGERRVVAHRLEQRRPADDVGGLRRLDEVERGAGVEALGDEHGRARLERGAEDERAADPEEGERAEEARRRAVGGLQRGERGRGAHDGAVRVHDALGVGAGARRVGDLREVGGDDLGLDRGAGGRR